MAANGRRHGRHHHLSEGKAVKIIGEGILRERGPAF